MNGTWPTWLSVIDRVSLALFIKQRSTGAVSHIYRLVVVCSKTAHHLLPAATLTLPPDNDSGKNCSSKRTTGHMCTWRAGFQTDARPLYECLFVHGITNHLYLINSLRSRWAMDWQWDERSTNMLLGNTGQHNSASPCKDTVDQANGRIHSWDRNWMGGTGSHRECTGQTDHG